MREYVKKNWKSLLSAAVIILLPMAVGVRLWDCLPDPIATHWDFKGNADGWTSRAFTVFGIPVVLLALHMVSVLVSETGKNSCGQNKKLKRIMHGVIPAVSLILCTFIYPKALGVDVPMQPMAMLYLSAVFLVIGNYMPKCTMNHRMGIRVPWTFESEENWNATHRFASRVYVILGLVCLVGVFVPSESFGAAIIIAALAGCCLPIVYSYLYSRKYGKKK